MYRKIIIEFLSQKNFLITDEFINRNKKWLNKDFLIELNFYKNIVLKDLFVNLKQYKKDKEKVLKEKNNNKIIKSTNKNNFHNINKENFTRNKLLCSKKLRENKENINLNKYIHN